VDVIARDQQIRPLSPRYDHIPGYKKLRGYQRQYVRNVDKKGRETGDFLKAIPKPLRQKYIQMVLETVPVYSGLQESSRFFPVESATMLGRGHFEERWRHAAATGQTEKFRINGVVSPAVDEERLNYGEDYVAKNYSEKALMDEFLTYVEEVPTPENSTPQAAWITMFLGSLRPDPNNMLHELTSVFFDQITQHPRHLLDVQRRWNLLPEGSGTLIEASEAVKHLYDAALKEMTGRREVAGKVEPHLQDWEIDFFKRIIVLTLRLPYTWTNFSSRAFRAA
jgi:hypothetical protein